MKKIWLMLLLFTVCLYTGCAQNPSDNSIHTEYEIIIDEQGNWYLKFTDMLPPLSDYAILASSAVEIEFSSITEMRTRIMEHQLTETECHKIMRIESDDPYLKQICNLDQLVEPVLPDDVEMTKVIWSCKDFYEFELTMTEGETFDLRVESKESFDSNLKNATALLYDSHSITSEKKIEDRNATEYLWENGKALQYQLESSQGTLIVQERYSIPVSSSEENESCMKLKYFMIFGIENDVYFQLTVFSPHERP